MRPTTRGKSKNIWSAEHAAILHPAGHLPSWGPTGPCTPGCRSGARSTCPCRPGWRSWGRTRGRSRGWATCTWGCRPVLLIKEENKHRGARLVWRACRGHTPTTPSNRNPIASHPTRAHPAIPTFGGSHTPSSSSSQTSGLVAVGSSTLSGSSSSHPSGLTALRSSIWRGASSCKDATRTEEHCEDAEGTGGRTGAARRRQGIQKKGTHVPVGGLLGLGVLDLGLVDPVLGLQRA